MFHLVRSPAGCIVTLTVALACAALFGPVAAPARARAAQVPPSSAGQAWGLVAGSGWYVSAELHDTGNRYGVLRARSAKARALR